MGITSFWPFRQDDHSQFEQLIRPHLKQLYRLAYRYTGKRDDAEDLVQELLLKLFPRLEEMKEIDKLAPWLSRVLYRQFIDHLRRQQRSPIDFMDEDDASYESHSSQTAEPSEVVNSELTRELINIALEKVNENHRILVLLHDVEGYSMPEISEIIDVPIGTIKSRLSRARNKLREIIIEMEPNAVPSV